MLIFRRSCVGSELVDWLLEQCPFVKCRSTAVGVWQLLLDMGIILSGQFCQYVQCQEGYPFLLHGFGRGFDQKRERNKAQFSCQFFIVLSFWETSVTFHFINTKDQSPGFGSFVPFAFANCRQCVSFTGFFFFFFSLQGILGFSQDSSCLVAADHGFTR